MFLRVCLFTGGVSAYKGGLHPGGSASRGERGSASGDGGVADPPELEKRALRILLECFLVIN